VVIGLRLERGRYGTVQSQRIVLVLGGFSEVLNGRMEAGYLHM
jgi:hypothetical protein